MLNYLKNQGTWKLSQLKKLKFEEIKEEFDKLVQQIDTFVPINLEATKAKLKRYGEELQTKTSKKQRFDDKDVPAIGEKVAEVKEEEPVKRTGKRKKQKARKGINVDKSAQEDSETDKEESVEAMNPTPLTTKSDSVVLICRLEVNSVMTVGAGEEMGYAEDIVPLLPAMLAEAAVDQGEGSTQPAEPHHTPVNPISSTSQPPIPSPPHPSPSPLSPYQSPPPSPHQSPPPSLNQSPPHSPYQSPPHSPFQSPPFSSPHFSPPRSYEAPLSECITSRSAEVSIQLKELMVLVPSLVTRVTTLKRKSKKVIVSESESKEPEDQGRIIQDIDDDPLVSLVRESMKEKKNQLLKARDIIGRARHAKNINIRLDVEEEINTGIKDVNTGSTKVDSSIASKRGQREEKAPMVEEDIQATHKIKEQMR
ncbi:hypothetical protein Tco_0347661 [Tanacetum coccineum]